MSESKDYVGEARVALHDLELLISSPSHKFSKHSATVVRELFNKMQELVISQSLLFENLKGKMEERTELLKVIHSAQEKTRSYAQAVNAPPKLTKKDREQHIVLVYPKNEKDSSDQLKKELTKNIDPAKLKVGIRNIRKINKGGVLIECTDSSDLEKLQNEIGRSDGLKDLSVRKPVKKNPQVILYDVEEDVNEENLIDILRKQNESINSGDLKVKFFMKNKKKRHAVLEVDPATFGTLMNKKKVNLKWSRLSVREFLKVIRCFKCSQFGHFQKDCKNEDTCGNCGEMGHRHWDCGSESVLHKLHHCK